MPVRVPKVFQSAPIAMGNTIPQGAGQDNTKSLSTKGRDERKDGESSGSAAKQERGFLDKKKGASRPPREESCTFGNDLEPVLKHRGDGIEVM